MQGLEHQLRPGRDELGGGVGPGGGSGYYGGGGGGGLSGTHGSSGGGGGSSFAAPGATNVAFETGVRSGDGLVTITYLG